MKSPTLSKKQLANLRYSQARQAEEMELSRRKIERNLAINWRPSKRSVKGNGRAVGRTDIKDGGLRDMKFRRLKFNAEYI